jgi:hypothetical protein
VGRPSSASLCHSRPVMSRSERSRRVPCELRAGAAGASAGGSSTKRVYPVIADASAGGPSADARTPLRLARG